MSLAALLGACAQVSTEFPQSSSTPSTDRSEILGRQLQAVLDGEYRAAYSYGIVGALVTSTSDRTAAERALGIHQRERDRLRTELTAMGRKPEPAPVAYSLPFPVRSATQARALAANVELALASDWDVLGAESPDPLATRARKAADDCRARAANWSPEASRSGR